jgi:ribosomal protein S18 acetylase RimI-like enzyme
MTPQPSVTRNRASAEEVAALLTACERDFSPPLSERQDIPTYAERICQRAERFEHWDAGLLVGLVAMYCVTPQGAPAFITNVSVRGEHRGRGLGGRLLGAALDHGRDCGFTHVALEVDAGATAARELYRKHGFVQQEARGATLLMQRRL